MSQTDRTHSFNPNEHVMQLKSKEGPKDYLPVQWRLVWFREQCPTGTITTELVHLDLDADTEEETYVWNNEKRHSEKVMKHGKGLAVFRATITDGKGGSATGTKMEKAVSFGDFLEKAETGAIGRALAALGYGTQFAPELNEEHRIVDSPVERPHPSEQPTNGAKPAPNVPTIGERLNAVWKALEPLIVESIAPKPLPPDWKAQVLKTVFNNRPPQKYGEEQVVALETYRIQLDAGVKRERERAATTA